MNLDPGQIVTLAFSGIVSLIAVGGSILVARRYRQLGGGEAQSKLNETYKELNDALADKIDVLTGLNTAAEERIADLNRTVEDLRAQLVVARKDRLSFQQDIDDLHDEVRALQRTSRATTKRADASDDRQDVSDERQDASAKREKGKP